MFLVLLLTLFISAWLLLKYFSWYPRIRGIRNRCEIEDLIQTSSYNLKFHVSHQLLLARLILGKFKDVVLRPHITQL